MSYSQSPPPPLSRASMVIGLYGAMGIVAFVIAAGREIVILALASSIGEELLFRGALLPWMGLWVQAAVFAALHIGPGRRFLPWTASALALGLAFGALAQWTGNLGGPIAAHFAINFLNLRYIVGVPVRAVAHS